PATAVAQSPRLDGEAARDRGRHPCAGLSQLRAGWRAGGLRRTRPQPLRPAATGVNRAQVQAVRYAVFDLLALNGDDLRTAPLLERKAALARLLEYARENPSTGPLAISSFLRGNGELAYKRACEAGLEGVISKSVDAPYRGGRS